MIRVSPVTKQAHRWRTLTAQRHNSLHFLLVYHQSHYQKKKRWNVSTLHRPTLPRLKAIQTPFLRVMKCPTLHKMNAPTLNQEKPPTFNQEKTPTTQL